MTRCDRSRKNLGIAQTMLTKRLAALTANGLLKKRHYSERPLCEEYVLTASGRDFMPVLLVIASWAQRNCGGDLDSHVDGETGLKMEPFAVDAISSAKIGSRPIQMKSAG